MGVYSIWPYFVCMAVLLGVEALPVFKAADQPIAQQNRRLTIDGLRGFLALGVFFHHAAMYQIALTQGVWSLPPSQFYILTGQFGVSMFFMITGYLFWSRVLRDKGRTDWASLYISRVFRIGPMYLFVIGVMFLFALAGTGLHLQVPPARLAMSVAKWLSLGLWQGGDVNGYDKTTLLLGMTWSLRWEWLFYLSLPILAILPRFIRARHAPLLFTATGLLLCLAYAASRGQGAEAGKGQLAVFAALFFTGMTCGSLENSGLRLKLPDWLGSLLAVGVLALAFAISPSGYRASAVALLAVVFYLISSGATLFGLLTLKPALRLGDISYSIYLLQGIVTTSALSFGPARDFAVQGPVQHWLLVLVNALILVVFANLTYHGVERTGIAWGKRATALWRTRFPRKTDAASRPAPSPVGIQP